MKIATAAYPLDPVTDWQAYADKLRAWVADAAGQGANLLLFPEYGAMELAMLDGPEAAGDLERALYAVARWVPRADALHSDLAAEFGVHICAASAPVFDDAWGVRPVNRARLFTPQGGCGVQDKQIMTRFEREDWDVVPGGPLTLFDTVLGKIGILTCYDAEFPLLGRALSDADVILVPSATEALAGYWRVRIGAMARALENQCVVAMASNVGDAAWCPAVDENTGMGGVFGPPDRGFPATGVMAESALNVPGWTYAEVDLRAVAAVRADGVVLNRCHWDEQAARVEKATATRLR